MASVADGIIESAPPPTGGAAAFIDRWIYVGMAVWILALVLIGFIPDSMMKVAMVEAGERPPFPAIMHVHALLMGAWILLLLAQATLMATGRRGMHMQLGLVSLVLAPAIVIAGFVLVPTMHAQYHAMVAAAPPPVAEELRATLLPQVTNILLAQLRIGIAFPILVGIALYLRLKDSETHKRLMILATLSPIPAAIDRMMFLPTTLPENPLAMDIYGFLAASPMFLWDVYRQKRVPRAYFIWLAVTVPLAIVLNILWNSPWWLESGPRLVGVG